MLYPRGTDGSRSVGIAGHKDVRPCSFVVRCVWWASSARLRFRQVDFQNQQMEEIRVCVFVGDNNHGFREDGRCCFFNGIAKMLRHQSVWGAFSRGLPSAKRMLRKMLHLRRSGVAKYRVSEQKDIGEHGCPLRFVNELFIPNVQF